MPDPLAAARADYVEQLLDAAMHVPAAANDPASGAIAGSLVASLARRQEDDRLEPFFTWEAGRTTSYETRCFDRANSLVSRTTYPRAGQAVRAALDGAAGEGLTAEVVAHADSDERSVLIVRERTPVLRVPIRPADVATVTPPAGAPSAVDHVETLRRMLSEMTVHVDATAIEEVVREAMDELRRDAATANGDGRAAPQTAPSVAGADVEEIALAVAVHVANLVPSAADIAARVVGSLTHDAGSEAPRDERRPTPAAAAPAAVAPTDDPLGPAVRDALSADATVPPGDPPVYPVRRGRQGLPRPKRLPGPSRVEP